MPCIHQFGIMDCLEDYIENEYEPEKYHCISIEDDFIDEIYPKGFGEKMKQLDTFAHNPNRPYKDLAYYGITLIPPTSFDYFLTILHEETTNTTSSELIQLINIVTLAKAQDKWVIHFGV